MALVFWIILFFVAILVITGTVSGAVLAWLVIATFIGVVVGATVSAILKI